MAIVNETTNAAVQGEIGGRIRAERIAMNLTQDELAFEAGLSRATVQRAEQRGDIRLEALIRIMRALGKLDQMDALLAQPKVRPLELVEQSGARRMRVRKKSPKGAAGEWQWGDEHD